MREHDAGGADTGAEPQRWVPAHTLRLVLGDQLNPLHSWFETPNASVVYVLMEVRAETDYVLHHAQKSWRFSRRCARSPRACGRPGTACVTSASTRPAIGSRSPPIWKR